ncbi:MAG TPA: hypothetical protein VLL75_13635, partial [Vicinamibacteria bacterium]|nr:hypothetical protein [Vicinamibacteria bacterium]
MRLAPLVPVALAGAAFALACGGTDGRKGSEARPLRIAFVPKGTTHEFWRTRHAGAVKGQRDLLARDVHVELIW